MVKLSNFDIFRKIPVDLTTASRRGGVLSILAGSVITLVIFLEVWTYVEGETKSRIVLDSNSEAKLDINFEISFFELPCRFANVEVWDYLGNAKLDTTSKIRKTVISGDFGEQHKGDFEHSGSVQTETVARDDASHSMREEVVELTPDTYGRYLKANEYTFVLYYVNWCMFCKMTFPVWSKFAKHLPLVRPNVKVAKLDCDEYAALCEASKISSYPTFIMFKGVNPLEQDYIGERSVAALTEYVTQVSDTPAEEHALKYQWHEGCLLRGRLNVNRVPGNFHITAKSDAHNFDKKSTNTSHMIHHLSFGKELPDNVWLQIPDDVRENIAPLDDLTFINHHGHMSHEHYIKVVSTRYEVGSLRGQREILGYQLTTSNHQYKSDPNVPEARFSYDLSPTAVLISQAGRRWYEFFTSLCALVGGTFTVIALADNVLHSLQRRLAAPITPSSKLT